MDACAGTTYLGTGRRISSQQYRQILKITTGGAMAAYRIQSDMNCVEGCNGRRRLNRYRYRY